MFSIFNRPKLISVGCYLGQSWALFIWVCSKQLKIYKILPIFFNAGLVQKHFIKDPQKLYDIFFQSFSQNNHQPILLNLNLHDSLCFNYQIQNGDVDLTDATLGDYVIRQIKQFSPLPMEELVYDYLVLQSNDIELYLTKKHHIESRQFIFKSPIFYLNRIELESLSLLRALAYINQTAKGNRVQELITKLQNQWIKQRDWAAMKNQIMLENETLGALMFKHLGEQMDEQLLKTYLYECLVVFGSFIHA